MNKVQKMSDGELMELATSRPTDPLGEAAFNELNFRQNRDIVNRIEFLEKKKPHWTVVPIFWLVVLSVILSLTPLLIALIKLLRSG